MGLVRHGFHAQQLQPQTVNTLEDAVELRLVDDLAREDRSPVFGLHVHPFEGHGVRTVELATHDYAVDSPCAPAHHLFTADLHNSSVSERSARQDGPSSPNGTFHLGDICLSLAR